MPLSLGLLLGVYVHDWFANDEELDAHAERIKANPDAIKRKEALKKSASEVKDGETISAKTEKEQGGEQDGEFELPEELPEDAIFVPLTFPRELPRTYYKGSDEAWQSFIALTRDKQKVKLLRNDLAGIVGESLSHIRNLQKALGKDIRSRKYWIDLDIPDGPPTEYERIGLEITDDYVAITTRPIDPLHVAQIKHTLWPKPIAISFWRSYEALWSAQLNSIKQYLNLSTASMSPDGDMEGGEIYAEDLEESSQEQESAANNGAVAEDTKPILPLGHPPIPDNHQPDEDSEDMTPLQKIILEPGRVSFEVLKHQLAKNWQPPHAPLMVYGSVLFSGLVELVGQKGTCVCDVHASYHPSEARWVTISVSIRRIQAFKQTPKGDRVRGEERGRVQDSVREE